MNDRQSSEKILQWFATAGVNETIGDIPVNRFAEPARMSANGIPSIPNADRENFSLARNASSLEELRNIIAQSVNCPLKSTAANMVFVER